MMLRSEGLSLRGAMPGTAARIVAKAGGRSGAQADAVLFAVCLLAFAGVAALCAALGSYLYMGTAKPGLPTTVEVSCGDQKAGEACGALAQKLGFGRWRVAVLKPQSSEVVVSLKVADSLAAAPGLLLVRAGYDRLGAHPPVDASAALLGTDQTVRLTAQKSPAPERTLIPLGRNAVDNGVVRLSIRGADGQAGALVLDEIGLFRSEADIRRVAGFHDLQPATHWKFRRALQNIALASLGLALIAAVVGRRWTAWYVPAAIGLVGLLVSFGLLLDGNGPEWALDLPATFAGGTVLEGGGANLNYGVYMAQGVLEGKGPLINDVPPWNRMPGYGYFVALGSIKGDLLRSVLNSVFLHVGFVGIALALLVAAAARIAPLWVAALAGAFIAVIPGTPHYTFIESMTVGLACLLLAAACLFVADLKERGSPRLSRHVILHAAFALWFFFRVDVLPGWVLISLALYAYPPRRWPMLGIPTLFMLAIGIPWALFKQRYTGEFSMTTNSSGASLMVGLWEVPHPFVWEVDDGSYFQWTQSAGLMGDRKAASDAATRETLLFWLAYPGYVVSLVWHKFMLFWTSQMAPGVWFFSDRISPKNAESMPYLRLAGLAVIAVAVAIRYRLLAILLLGAILFFDAPLYFLVYSSAGRFYNVALVALLLLTALLLCDPQFYRTIGKRPLAAGSAIALALAVGLGGQKLDDLMIASDGFRFASPFHASAPSRLAIRKAVAPRREEPVREPSSEIALADLAAAQTVAVTSEGDGVRFTAPVGRSRTIAAAPLPADFLTARNCRIRLEMKVSQGALGVGVETTDGAAPLLSEPVRPLPAGAPDFTPLDFNVPIGDRAPAGPVRIVLRSAGDKPVDVTLRRAMVHGCTPPSIE